MLVYVVMDTNFSVLFLASCYNMTCDVILMAVVSNYMYEQRAELTMNQIEKKGYMYNKSSRPKIFKKVFIFSFQVHTIYAKLQAI